MQKTPECYAGRKSIVFPSEIKKQFEHVCSSPLFGPVFSARFLPPSPRCPIPQHLKQHPPQRLVHRSDELPLTPLRVGKESLVQQARLENVLQSGVEEACVPAVVQTSRR